MSEQSVLYVDDEVHNLQAMKRLLRRESFVLETATGGSDGLDVLKRKSVQVILSDYRMPLMNGVDFLVQTRSICPNAYRVIVSGYADSEAIKVALAQGDIDLFIAKPWNDEELKLMLQKQLKE